MAGLALRFSIALSVCLLVTADFTADCPVECKCGWYKGSKQADCSHSVFHDIPNNLSPETQILDLTANDLNKIKRHAFREAGLINLKKLILSECKLTSIDENALTNLQILIVIDLSKNELKTLPTEIFKETPKIRWILLNDNQIEKLEDGLFNNLPGLYKVDLSNNHITQIGMETFLNVPKLERLKLNNNKLEQLEKDKLNALTSIYLVLDVHDNPWRCDCNLKPLVNWVIGERFSATPISCSEPPLVQGKLWSELESSDFACE
ncbi:insulin-like growth factor-binding protein complex acid labile subunit [Bicyclus anynana]|uniref:Insulin-like growth factor-binding protein complex acid labile subunit n=1 Tax=Bicyclus anynana TaxID=110368 RepID=A0ABM3LZR6_BICAN|nr:insulin-like growth factor-binding protein complex acid labile subunit [Bicyclus anynana]